MKGLVTAYNEQISLHQIHCQYCKKGSNSTGKQPVVSFTRSHSKFYHYSTPTCSKVMFSVVFVRHSVNVGGSYVALTHDALDLTVQGRPSPLPSGHGNSLYTDTDPASADIW